MEEGIVHAAFVDVQDPCGPLSPETSEFINLERQLIMDEPNFIIGQQSPVPNIPSVQHNSSRKSSEIQREMEAEEQSRQLLQSELEEKLEERKRSMELSSTENGLQLMERRQFRQFSRADEYLYAMKEDLAEWMNNLYPHIDMDADNFMTRLETGENLVQHANAVRQKCLDLLDLIAAGETKQRPPNFEVPERELPCRFNVQAGTWFARDNVFNFILFCRRLGVMECIMFETEDLVCRKNEKHVILTLLEVARRGAKLGMLAPMLVQFEQEIDREIAREERQKRKEEKEEEKRRKEEEKLKLAELKRRQKEIEEQEAAREKAEKLIQQQQNALLNHTGEVFDSMQVEFDQEENFGNLADVEDLGLLNEELEDELEETEPEEEEEEEEEEEDEDVFGYEYPIGPMPQCVNNDLKSLDEMVRELVSECQCPTQFPMIRVAEGKYRIGDTQVLIFVRILRNHVMVRVGGGWDTLQHYLDKHDPCRCNAGHKAASHAQIKLKNGRNGPMAVGVCYDRNELIFAFRKSSEPPVAVPHTRLFESWRTESPRRRSSTTNLNNLGRRSSSLTPNQAGSTVSINHQSPQSKIITSPKSRSSSSQQLIAGSNPKARALYAKQGSASLLLQNAQANSTNNLIHSVTHGNQNKTKSSLAKSSSLQPSGFGSISESPGNSASPIKKSSKDTLSTCDSSSEVSDEGYKSSQGNGVSTSASPNSARALTDASSGCTKSETSSQEDRPESSLTVASECSSTISSEEEAAKKAEEAVKEVEPRPASPNSSISEDEDSGEGGDTWATPTNQSTPSKDSETNEKNTLATSAGNSTKNRLANLFNHMKIPKFKMKNHNSEPPSLETTPKKAATPRFNRSNSMSSEASGATNQAFTRNTKERHSYRAPSATSRYMQAAEAYAAKNRAASSASKTTNGTWSSSSAKNSFSSRGRQSRPALTSDTFRPPSRTSSRPASRTTSASPGPHRRSMDNVLSGSTHSTPCKKPVKTSGKTSAETAKISAKSQKALAEMDLDEEDAILKKMEEILLTYKSRVETHLAAEGRELPKEIFEDFTSQWVAASTARPLSRSATADMPGPSHASGHHAVMSRSSTADIQTPKMKPSPRKAKRDSSNTRIPVPTFYNN